MSGVAGGDPSGAPHPVRGSRAQRGRMALVVRICVAADSAEPGAEAGVSSADRVPGPVKAGDQRCHPLADSVVLERTVLDSAGRPHTRLGRPGSTRRRQWICADSRVRTAADMLFRFYVHTPGKPLSVIDGKAEVKDAIPRLRSLRSLSPANV